MRSKLILLSILVFVSGCVAHTSPPPTGERVYSGPSEASSGEEKILQELVNASIPKQKPMSVLEQKRQLEKVFTRLKDGNSELCARIIDHTNLRDCQWLHLNGHDLPTINSYSWNDLYINVTSKLLTYASNDDEVAYVLAHEMGHQLAEHVTENLSLVTASFNVERNLGRFLLCGACVLIKAPGANYAEEVAAENALFGEMTDNYFKDYQEREADYIAAYLMMRAGYDIGKGTKFLHTMYALNPKSGEKMKHKAQYFDTHTFTNKKILHLSQTIAEIELKQKNGHPLFPEAD